MLNVGFLDLLSKEYKDISPILNDNFDFVDETQKYHMHPNRKFKSRIDVRLRIKYFLTSYMRRMEHQQYYPTFDEIILNIMPLLKNGITPEKQTILSILGEIAVRTGEGRWKLADYEQPPLF